MKRIKLTPEQQIQSDKLTQQFCQSLNRLKQEGSKRPDRKALTARLRAKARKNGVTEQEVKKIRASASPYIHTDATAKNYKNTCRRFVKWLVTTHP